MLGQLRAVLVSLLVVAANVVAAGAPASATGVAPASVGFDVSFPQCGSPLPSPAGFGIVGVNNGHPFSVNPCLVSEVQWAGTTLSASPQFYVNTDNPGPSNNANWPRSQSAPRVCAGADSIACSFDYGWNAGQGSFQAVVGVETQLGAASPTGVAQSSQWWLDVETGNLWESLRNATGPTSAQYANDAAVLQGELAYFASIGITSVGIYSTASQFGAIAGATLPRFAANKLWVPGFATLAAAQAACNMASFTGGRIAMIQYPSRGLDGDYACGLVTTPSAASVSLATSASFTDQLAVAGESAPVTYTQSSGAPALVVSSTGLVSTGSALAPGVYSASGTSSAAGLSGTYTFTLTVGLLSQSSPTSATSSVPASATFSSQVAATGASGPITFSQTSGAPALLVSPSGLVTTQGTLPRATYHVTGTMSDASGDSGTFSLAVSVGTLTQSSPIRLSVTPGAAATLSNQLTASGASGALTFTQSTGAPALVVSPSGLITTSGVLAAGSYVARGVVADAGGDQGNYFFNLLVSSVTLAQTSPTSASVTPSASATYSSQIAVKGAAGAVSFTQSAGTPNLVVSPSGLVTTGGALVSGVYSASGTMVDGAGDPGSFTFTLSVAVVAPPPPPAPAATRVLGHALTGHTVTLTILGHGFVGRPTVVGRAGTSALVIRDTGTALTVRVTVAPHTRRGVYTFVIALATGALCSVRYVQR